MPFITADNASELGRKSGEVRRQQKDRINTLTGILIHSPNNRLIQEPDLARSVVELLKIVTEQIARTRQLLNSEDYHYCSECERGGIEPHHRAQLIKALDSLIERKTALLGIPGPGNLKPSSRPQQSRPRMVEPLDVAPQDTTDGVQPAPTQPDSPKP